MSNSHTLFELSDNERWIEGWEGIYSVDTNAHVYTYKTGEKVRFKSFLEHPAGGWIIVISKNNDYTSKHLRSVVARAFLGYERGDRIESINGDLFDASVDNLRVLKKKAVIPLPDDAEWLFEGYYYLTMDGNVYSTLYGKVRKMSKHKTRMGYIVTLKIKEKPRTFLLHRIVAKKFCKRRYLYNKVAFKDGDMYNCHYENLEWV